MSINNVWGMAGIRQQTVQEWLSKDEELLLKYTAWQNEMSKEALKIILKKIKAGELTVAQWWLERKERDDFATRTETHQSGSVTVIQKSSILEGDKDGKKKKKDQKASKEDEMVPLQED